MPELLKEFDVNAPGFDPRNEDGEYVVDLNALCAKLLPLAVNQLNKAKGRYAEEDASWATFQAIRSVDPKRGMPFVRGFLMRVSQIGIDLARSRRPAGIKRPAPDAVIPQTGSLNSDYGEEKPADGLFDALRRIDLMPDALARFACLGIVLGDWDRRTTARIIGHKPEEIEHALAAVQ